MRQNRGVPLCRLEHVAAVYPMDEVDGQSANVRKVAPITW